MQPLDFYVMTAVINPLMDSTEQWDALQDLFTMVRVLLAAC